MRVFEHGLVLQGGLAASAATGGNGNVSCGPSSTAAGGDCNSVSGFVGSSLGGGRALNTDDATSPARP